TSMPVCSLRIDCTHTFLLPLHPPPTSTLFPYTTLFRSDLGGGDGNLSLHHDYQLPGRHRIDHHHAQGADECRTGHPDFPLTRPGDRKSTRLNSSHRTISYAVFCLKKKKTNSYHS